MPKEKNFASEMRLDPISKDWVVVAQKRAKRPESSKKSGCPFCSFNGLVAVPNKFPAFSGKPKGQTSKKFGVQSGEVCPLGLPFFAKKPAVGAHEVIVFKDHNLTIADLSIVEIKKIIDIYQQRYLALAEPKEINYVFIFHNQGKMAGASIAHPHSQIIAAPTADFSFLAPLKKAKEFYEQNKKCVYCSEIKAEIKAKKRVVSENNSFIAFCPFASKISFEINIFPKKHQPYFEKITAKEKQDLAQILKIVLSQLKKSLDDPDYNFYIKTAPCDENSHPYFHWHLVIMPRISVWAGFELGSGMEIVSTAPEQAADILRKVKV